MAKPFAVKLDHRGIAGKMKDAEMTSAIRLKTEQLAARVRGMGITVGAFSGNGEIPLPVEAKVITTDRAHGIVTIAHPAGQAVQAKHGALTKGAAQVGLDVGGEK